MKRIKELDLTKTFIIVVSMIGIHTMYDLADVGPSLPTSVLNVLATAWGAPVFMFCMGIVLGFSRHNEARDMLRRGVHLITIGMALNVLRYAPLAFKAYAVSDPGLIKGLAQIFNVDILQFAGLAFMLLALCKRLRMGSWSVLGLSVVMSVVGTLLIGHYTSSYMVNQVLGYFYHTPTCSCFPLLNWFIFVAAGKVMGEVVYSSESRHASSLRNISVFIICGIIAIVHQYLSITGNCPWFRTLENDWEFYSMPTQDALCIAFGVAPFEIGVFWLLAKIIPDNWMSVLGYPARHINQFYCVSWVWIMWIACFLWFIRPATTFAEFVVVWIVIVALTTVTVVVYNRWLKERVAPWFGRYEKAWNIAVWVVIVGFGVWYFTNIPGPYIMPY